MLGKKCVLGLKNPVTSAKEGHNSSLHASSEMIGDVKGKWDFQLMITSRNLKGRGGTVKNIGMLQMTENSRESSATKARLKNAFYSVTNTRMPG